MKHHGPISGLASNGNYVATAGYDNQVILWCAATGEALARGLHDHLANQCHFSPCGSLLVSASSDYSARVWEVPTMRLRAVLGKHIDDVDMACFSPCGRYIATCARGDFGIRVFTPSGELLNTLFGHTDYITSVAWTGDSRWLISSSDDGTIKSWDADGGMLLKNYDCDGVQTETVVVDSNGTLYAGDDTGRIHIITPTKRTEYPAHTAGVKRLFFSTNESHLASAGYDGQLTIWVRSSEGLTNTHKIELPVIVWPRSGAFISPTRLALATFGSRYAELDLDSLAWNLEGIEPDRSINAVAAVQGDHFTVGDAGTVFRNGERVCDLGSLCNFLLPVNGRLFTGGQLGIVFDAYTGAVVFRHRSPLNCGTVLPGGEKTRFMIGSYTGEGLVFELYPDGQVHHVATLLLHDNAVKGLACNRGTFFSVCATAEVALHDVASLEVVKRIERAHDEIVNACCAVDGGYASVGRDRKLKVWANDKVDAYATPHENSIKCIASSDDGKLVASGSYAGRIAIFRVPTRSWAYSRRIAATGVSCITYDSTRKSFVASTYDGQTHSIPVVH